MAYEKPLPKRIPKLEQPFWDGLKRHEVRLQKCSDCGHIWFPPYTYCPKCLSANHEWKKLSGRGKLLSWIVFHQNYFKSFSKDLPYNVAWVQLEEGPKIISNIVDCRNEDIRCGMPVEAHYDDVTETFTLLKFKLAKA